MGTSPLFGGYNPVVPNATSGKGIQGTLQRQSTNLGNQTTGTLGQRATESGSLIPGYQSLLDSGYSPQEKPAIKAHWAESIRLMAGRKMRQVAGWLELAIQRDSVRF